MMSTTSSNGAIILDRNNVQASALYHHTCKYISTYDEHKVHGNIISEVRKEQGAEGEGKGNDTCKESYDRPKYARWVCC